MQPMRLYLELAAPGAPLRAAAAVRAAAFGKNLPPGRSPWAQSAFVRVKASEHWADLEAKVAGTDPAWAGVRVVCLLASVFESGEDGGDGGREGDGGATPTMAVLDLPALPLSLPADLAAATDASCCLPGAAGSGAGRRWAVATLDLNFGASLPSERLRADVPPGAPLQSLAYLSNVSTAGPARRRGVARAVVTHAARVLAPSMGARRVAVHAASPVAESLYRAVGFVEAQHESCAAARARCEAPRRLFVMDIV
jgi:ribosomal protein S18 acetylase RimI-like enzyme